MMGLSRLDIGNLFQEKTYSVCNFPGRGGQSHNDVHGRQTFRGGVSGNGKHILEIKCLIF